MKEKPGGSDMGVTDEMVTGDIKKNVSHEGVLLDTAQDIFDRVRNDFVEMMKEEFKEESFKERDAEKGLNQLITGGVLDVLQ